MRVLAFPAFKNRRSNPYNYLLYTAMQEAGLEIREFRIKSLFRERFDIVHIHWPEFYLNSHHRLKAWIFSLLLLVGLALAKARGARVVWTMHNLHPHEVRYPVASQLFWYCFLALVDGYTAFSDTARKAALATYPKLERLSGVITRHGLYEGEYPPLSPAAEAATRLGLSQEQPVILFFGRVKSYKNAVGLIDAFIDLTREGGAATLVIAGKIDSDYRSQLLEAACDREDIIVRDEFLEPEVIAEYLSAATLCVLPYRQILNSGSIFLSATYRTATLVPRSENFEEYGQLMGRGALLFFDGVLSARDLSHALVAASDAQFAISEELDWKNIGRSTADFFASLIPLHDKSPNKEPSF